jgi:hypothetical protein
MIPTDKIPAKPATPSLEIPPPRLAAELYRESKRGIGKNVPSTIYKDSHSQHNLFVILVCPRCHTRVEASYDEWCVSKLPGRGLKKFLCKNLLCDGKELVYHKMVGE